MAVLMFVAVVVAGVAIGVPAYTMFFRLLDQRHGQVYESMGRPTIWNRSVTKSFRVQRFLFRGEYRPLDDPELSRVSTFLRYFNPILILSVVVASAILIADLV